MRSTEHAITVVSVDHQHVVRLAGELDIATAPTVFETLSRLHGPVFVDMTDVTFLDSSALRSLLVAHRHAARRGERLVVHEASEAVRRVMQLLDVGRILTDRSD
jgi:anti-anti-sigma factor